MSITTFYVQLSSLAARYSLLTTQTLRRYPGQDLFCTPFARAANLRTKYAGIKTWFPSKSRQHQVSPFNVRPKRSSRVFCHAEPAQNGVRLTFGLNELCLSRYRTVAKQSNVDESLFGNKAPMRGFASDKSTSPGKALKSPTSKLQTNTALQPIQADVVTIRRYAPLWPTQHSPAHTCHPPLGWLCITNAFMPIFDVISSPALYSSWHRPKQ